MGWQNESGSHRDARGNAESEAEVGSAGIAVALIVPKENSTPLDNNGDAVL